MPNSVIFPTHANSRKSTDSRRSSDTTGQTSLKSRRKSNPERRKSAPAATIKQELLKRLDEINTTMKELSIDVSEDESTSLASNEDVLQYVSKSLDKIEVVLERKLAAKKSKSDQKILFKDVATSTDDFHSTATQAQSASVPAAKDICKELA